MDKGIIFAAGVSVACLGAFAIGYRIGSRDSYLFKLTPDGSLMRVSKETTKEPPKPREHNSSVKEVTHNYISTEPKRKLGDKIIDKAIDRATQKIIDNAKVDISITF